MPLVVGPGPVVTSSTQLVSGLPAGASFSTMPRPNSGVGNAIEAPAVGYPAVTGPAESACASTTGSWPPPLSMPPTPGAPAAVAAATSDGSAPAAMAACNAATSRPGATSTGGLAPGTPGTAGTPGTSPSGIAVRGAPPSNPRTSASSAIFDSRPRSIRRPSSSRI